MIETTQEKIKRIKVDCLYGKKRHFNAADRKEKYQYLIGIPLIAVNVLTGSILFYVFTDEAKGWVKYIPIVLSFISAILSAYQTFFNFNKQVEGHKRVGNRYLAIMKRIDRIQGYIKDNLISNENIMLRVEEISIEIEDINKEAEQYPTNRTDFNMAKVGIQKGEEDYEEKELEL